MVHLHDDDIGAIKLTGIYPPLEGAQKYGKLKILTDGRSSKLLRGGSEGPILAGDFNHPS